MNYSLDRQKAVEMAKKLGIEISFDNENPGVFVKDMVKAETTQYSFNCFFPELKELDGLDDDQSTFVTKDTGRIESGKISISHHTSKARVINVKPFMSTVHLNQLNEAV